MNSEWAQALQQSLIEKDDFVPEGWKTTHQIAVELGKCRRHTGTLISGLVAERRVETKTFRVDGRLTPHYRLAVKSVGAQAS